MNFPLVSKLLGVVMLILAIAFAVCLGVSFQLDTQEFGKLARTAFIASTCTALVGAGMFFWVGRRHTKKFFRKEALCTIGISWLLASLVGAIPYMIVVPEVGFAGAIFEAASGLTTTGASVLSNLEQLPPSLLFWRSLSQWIGGMGVVVFFVAVLGFIGVGGKMLYANEASGTVSEFEESRIQSTVARLVWVYIGLSLACTLSFWIAGMNLFEAINHAFTTLSTGGFSTRSGSLADFHSPAMEWIAIVFMILGGVSFLLIIRLSCGRFYFLRRNTEFLAYLLIIVFASLMIASTLVLDGTSNEAHHAIRAATFQVVTIMTTTGFATEDYVAWSALPQMTLLLLMVAGGCSGSTAGGIKIYRIVVAIRISLLSVERSFRTRVVRQIRLNGNVLSQQALSDVSIYLILTSGVVLSSIIVVSIFEPNLKVDTNLSAVFACFFNIGPGLAEVGPTENFAFMHTHTKYFLALLMIMGRLELYAILALFSPSLWKRFS
ncbi:TrkH family potassium uptake protein [Pelagicoccus albus]|uniref:TrkH family potassium uptake protein n=1 Tax=Pelagicoccus albus TaxID=415222 RepID=A0A7X1B5T3_9BACT|nr:TrkH family potassium uptake protein [Pelagicoccus albus]MBC2606147.1 TrkH family potassium uptake protein [Pelagicoccus albus]